MILQMLKNFFNKRFTNRYPFKEVRMSKGWKGNKLWYDRPASPQEGKIGR